MKREFITGLLPEISKETLDAIMSENGKDVEAMKAKYADYDALKTQIAQAGKTIEGFQAMDIESIKAEAENWRQKAQQAQSEAAAKIAQISFSSALEAAITGAKGRNAKAIGALLDVEALRASQNQSQDIQAALQAVKAQNAYLFEESATPPPYAAGTGTKPLGGAQSGVEAAFARLNPNLNM